MKEKGSTNDHVLRAVRLCAGVETMTMQAALQLPLWPISDVWVPVRDGHDSARALFDRHYSRYHYADGRKPLLFVGPGEKLVLMTHCRRALFVWRKFISDDGQKGVNCAIFRNEGAGLSSDLIREADHIAWERWPDPDSERHYTYVNPSAVRSTNPGFCFRAAGWNRCGVTKWRRLLILEIVRR